MDEKNSWRALLAKIISNPEKKMQIAEALGIQPITLTRWAEHISTPRPQKLRALLDAVPLQYKEQLGVLLKGEYELEVESIKQVEEIEMEIPSAFYARVLSASTISSAPERAATLRMLILQRMLAHLDPANQGLMILIMLCVPPAEGKKVRSLYLSLGQGQGPWWHPLDERIVFCGAESQVGHTVRTGSPAVTQSKEERERLFPVHQPQFAHSVASLPLLLGDQIAGCLYITSIHEHYFTQAHVKLLQDYAALLVVSFEPGEFFSFDQIELELMPPLVEQQHYVRQFKQRVRQLLARSRKEGKRVSSSEVELQVVRKLEEQLLFLALHPSSEQGLRASNTVG